MTRWRSRPWWFWLAWPGVLLHVGTALLRLGSFWPYPRLLDFSGFYAAAWAWRAGLSPYAIPEAWLTELMRAQTIPFRPPPIYNPPLLILLLQPFTLVPFPIAAWLWLGLNGILAVFSALWLADLAGIRSRWGKAGVVLLVLSYGPLWLDASLGQVSIILLTCALVWLRGTEGQRLLPSSLALALAGSLKIFPYYWAGAALFTRRGRALAGAALATLLLLALSWGSLPQANREYWNQALSGRLSSSTATPGVDDQSLLAWALRLTQAQTFTLAGLDPHARITLTWVPRTVLPASGVVMATLALGLVLTGCSIRALVRSARAEARGAWALWLLLGLLGLIHMERYNHVLLLPALAWLWGPRPQSRGWVVSAYVLEGLGRLTHAFALSLPFPWAAWASGWGLYAVLLILVVLVKTLEAPGQVTLPKGDR